MDNKNNTPMLDFKEIQELVKLVKRSQLNEFNLKFGDFKIEIKYNTHGNVIVEENISTSNISAPSNAPTTSAPVQVVAESPAAPAVSNDKNYITIKSPMIGTFYRSSNPESPAFVNVGDNISQGQTICIVEAMKLFNEIESDFEGKLVKILVEDASPVEYDQPLFLLEP